MTQRLLDIIGLCILLLIAAFPNAAWPATPAPSPTPMPCPTDRVCLPNSPHHWLCFRDAFSGDGAVPEQPIGCVPLPPSPRPTHVPSPLPYVILCPKDTRRCSVYELHNGAYEWIQTATPLPGTSP